MPFDEVLFYDDASTDRSVMMLESKGFKVIRGSENKGQGYARNRLAEASTCTWLHFHDIDDLLTVDYLAKTAAIAENDAIDVVLCNVDWYNQHGNKVILRWYYLNSEIKLNPVSYTIANPIGGINGLYRKSKFIAAGGFNSAMRIWEDADMHVRLAACNAKFHIVEEVLAIAIRYPRSASTDQVSGWLNRLKCLKDYFERFKDEINRTTIGKQAQLTASRLVLCRRYDAAKAALLLSEQCDVKVPDNNNRLWSILKLITPARLRIRLRIAQLKYAFAKSKI